MYQNIWFDVRKNKMHLWDDTKGYLQLPYKKYAYVKNRNGQHISLYGDRLKRVTGFDKDAIERLRRYRWPGNVRELKNAIERAVVLARGAEIEVDELVLSNLATASESYMDMGTLSHRYIAETLSDVERRHIESTLVATGWNKSRSAQILGIERSTLDRKIKKYGIIKTD